MDTSVLFSLQATGAIKLKKLREDQNGDVSYKMKMRKVNDNVTWFTDRPKREAGSGTLRDLIREWDDSFRTSNPNSALAYIDKDGNPDTIVFEQYKPKFNKRKGILTSKIKVHSDQDLKDISSKRRNPLSELALDARLDDNNSFDHKFKSGSLFIDNWFARNTEVKITNNTNQTILFTQLGQNTKDTDWEKVILEAAVEIGTMIGCGASLVANPSPARVIEPSKRGLNNKNLGPLGRENGRAIAKELFESISSVNENGQGVELSEAGSIIGSEFEFAKGGGDFEALASMAGDEVNVVAEPVLDFGGGIADIAEGVEFEIGEEAAESLLKGATGKAGAALCLVGTGVAFIKNVTSALRGSYTDGFYPIKKTSNILAEDSKPDDSKTGDEYDYYTLIPSKQSISFNRTEGDFTKEGSKDVNFAINILPPTDDKFVIPYGVFSFDNPAIGHPKAYYKQLSGFNYSNVVEDRIIESGEEGDTKTVRNRNYVIGDVTSTVTYNDKQTSDFNEDDTVIGWSVTFEGDVANDVLDTLGKSASLIVPD